MAPPRLALRLLAVATVARRAVPESPVPPYRIWASPFNFSSAPEDQLGRRFRGANVLLNSDVKPPDVPRYVAAGLTPLKWAVRAHASRLNLWFIEVS